MLRTSARSPRRRGILGIPDPSSMASRVFGRQPAARQARGLAQRRQRLGEDARDERAAVAPVRRAGDVEDGGLAPDRCEVDLAVPEHSADVVVAEGHEVVARGGDEGLPSAAVRRGDEEELARRVSRRQVRGELLQRLHGALPVAGFQEREHGREVPRAVGDPLVRYREQAEAGQQVAAGVREEPLARGEGVGHDGG